MASSGEAAERPVVELEADDLWVENQLDEAEGGHLYFYNTKSRECVYDRPEGARVITQAEYDERLAQQGADDEDDKVELSPDDLPDWEYVVDADGDKYWWNAKRGISMWENPVEVLARQQLDEARRRKESADEGGAADPRDHILEETVAQLSELRTENLQLKQKNKELEQESLQMSEALALALERAQAAEEEIQRQRHSLDKLKRKLGIAVEKYRRATQPMLQSALEGLGSLSDDEEDDEDDSVASPTAVKPVKPGKRAAPRPNPKPELAAEGNGTAEVNGTAEHAAGEAGDTVGAAAATAASPVPGASPKARGTGLSSMSSLLRSRTVSDLDGDEAVPADPEQEEELTTLQFLKSVEMFHALSEQQLHQLVSKMKEETFEDGDIIIQQGEQGASFYVIKEGVVVVRKAEKAPLRFAIDGATPEQIEANLGPAVAELGRGFFFGERALLLREARAASCLAGSAVRVLSLDRDSFQEVMSGLDEAMTSYSRQFYGDEADKGIDITKHVNSFALLLKAAREEARTQAAKETAPPASGAGSGGLVGRVVVQDEDGNMQVVARDDENASIVDPLDRPVDADHEMSAARAVGEMMSLMSPELGLRELLTRVTGAVEGFLAAERADVLYVNPSTKELFVPRDMAGKGRQQGRDLSRKVSSAGSGIVEAVLEAAEPIFVDDTAADARFADGPTSWRQAYHDLLSVDVQTPEEAAAAAAAVADAVAAAAADPAAADSGSLELWAGKPGELHLRSLAAVPVFNGSGLVVAVLLVANRGCHRHSDDASSIISFASGLASAGAGSTPKGQQPLRRASQAHGTRSLRRFSMLRTYNATHMSERVLSVQSPLVAETAAAPPAAAASPPRRKVKPPPKKGKKPGRKPSAADEDADGAISPKGGSPKVGSPRVSSPKVAPPPKTGKKVPPGPPATGSPKKPAPMPPTGAAAPDNGLEKHFTERDRALLGGAADSVASAIDERELEWTAATELSNIMPLYSLRGQLNIKVRNARLLNAPPSVTRSRNTGRVKKLATGSNVRVSLALYHGCVLLCDPIASRPASLELQRADAEHASRAAAKAIGRSKKDRQDAGPASLAAHGQELLAEWEAGQGALKLPIRLCDLPAAAKIVVNVAHNDGTPIGWAGLTLFNHSHTLRTGSVSLRLWPDQVDESTIAHTTALSNVFAPEGEVPELTLELPCFDTPVLRLAAPPPFFPGSSVGLPAMPPKKSGAAAAAAGGASAGMPPGWTMGTTSRKRDIGAAAGQNSDQAVSPAEFAGLKAQVDEITRQDPLYRLSADEAAVVWRCRGHLVDRPDALPFFLQSVPWNSGRSVAEALGYLRHWAPPDPMAALRLLDARFPDPRVRAFAVSCLEQMDEDELGRYLLQLSQVLKFEPHLDSALARFLLRRAVRHPRVVGHQLFWLLKGEMHIPAVAVRYGVFLEQYLRNCGAHRTELGHQMFVMSRLENIAMEIKDCKGKEGRKQYLHTQLPKVVLPDRFQLPLSPHMVASSIDVPKCRVMNSKKLPLWLNFRSAEDPEKRHIVLFKAGDDLRQDQLTLQVLRVMDRLWRSEGLDLCMNPYGCVSTGDEVGMLEIVGNSATLAGIVADKVAGSKGGIAFKLRAAMSAYKEDTLHSWLRKQGDNEANWDKVTDKFARSCAGYCVATYVLGIGDRHNDNVMMTREGGFFHIDFGHFLGNFKSKMGIKREKAPFIWTPSMAFVLGKEGSPKYREFEDLCCRAYNILRKHSNLLITLFFLMLACGIPELRREKDIGWLQQKLSPGMSQTEAAEHMKAKIHEALNTRTTLFNDACHLLKHA